MRVWWIWALVSSLLVASQVAADPTAVEAVQVVVPRDAIFMRSKIGGGYGELGPAGPYYPERAARSGISGVAVIDCTLAASGQLSQCTIKSQTPNNEDFGAAAVVMARRGAIQAQPRVVDGQPVASEEVLVRVPFQIGGR